MVHREAWRGVEEYWVELSFGDKLRGILEIREQAVLLAGLGL